MERRKFIAGASSMALLANQGFAQKSPKKTKEPIILFEKPIQEMSYDRMGEELAKMGVQGIEATIRKKGHIEPTNAAKEVPKMVEALAKSGQKALVAATSVKEVSPETEKFLRVLKENGIEKYRMDYYRYDLKKEMLPQLRDHQAKLKDLAALNKDLGIQAIYQLHSGFKMAGGLAWDAAIMFEGINPDEAAIGFDFRHVRTDCGLSFDVAVAALKKHVRMLYIKDAEWSEERNEKLNRVALDTGFVNQKMFRKVRKALQPMPMSVHLEWGAHKVYPKDQVEEALRFFERDVKVLKGWM